MLQKPSILAIFCHFCAIRIFPETIQLKVMSASKLCTFSDWEESCSGISLFWNAYWWFITNSVHPLYKPQDEAAPTPKMLWKRRDALGSLKEELMLLGVFCFSHFLGTWAEKKCNWVHSEMHKCWAIAPLIAYTTQLQKQYSIAATVFYQEGS